MKNENSLARRDDLMVIQISGQEAMTFLQGLVCCDMTDLANTQPLFSASCDHKGRIIVNFWIWQESETYFLLIPQSMLNITLDHFKPYARLSKVTLQPDPNWIVFNYTGPENNLPHMAELLNTQLKIDTQPPGIMYWIIGHPPAMEKLWQQLSPKSEIINENDWHLLMILAEFAYICPQTSGLFVPQMISLDKFNGISFKKGCYLGQEVIARAKNLGQLKRHLHRFELQSTQKPTLGQPLQDDSGEII
jgi:tRNA-modifying protein YgfZ